MEGSSWSERACWSVRGRLLLQGEEVQVSRRRGRSENQVQGLSQFEAWTPGHWKGGGSRSPPFKRERVSAAEPQNPSTVGKVLLDESCVSGLVWKQRTRQLAC